MTGLRHEPDVSRSPRLSAGIATGRVAGMRASPTLKLIATFGLVAATFFGSAWIAKTSQDRHVFRLQWVSHTHEVLRVLEELTTDSRDLQRGVRGYVLSGDPRFVQTYRRALPRADAHAALLTTLIQSPDLSKRFAHARPALPALVAALKGVMALAAEQGRDAAAARLRSGDVDARFDAFVAQLDDISAIQWQRLRQRQAEAATAARESAYATLAVNVAGALILAILLLFVRRDLLARERDLERQRLLLDSVPDPTLLIAADGRVEYANRQTAAVLGWQPAELQGQSMEVLVPSALRARHVKHRQDFAADPKTRPMGVGMDLHVVRKDGRQVPVEISLSPIRMDERDFVLCAIRDVSEQRRVQAELRRYETEVFDLWNRAPVGYHTVGPDRRILRINDTELGWLGYSRQEMEGHLIDEFQPPSTQAVVAARYPRFMAAGHIEDLALDFVRKNGTLLHVVINATAVRDEAGRFQTSRTVMLDVGEAGHVHDPDGTPGLAQPGGLLSAEGVVPMCAWCRRLREADGNFVAVEQYLVSHGGIRTSHGICPDCTARLGVPIEP